MSKFKVAVCLMGLSDGKNDKGDSVQNGSSTSIKKNIIESHDADVFFHTWKKSTAHIDGLVDTYSPVSYIAEPQIMFESDPSNKLHWTKSRWFSHKRVLKLVDEYESNFEYDYVFVTRFDCEYYTKFDFTKYNPEKFWVANWPDNRGPMGFIDLWFLSNSKNMKKYGKIYDYLTNETIEAYGISNHTIAYEMVRNFNIEWDYTEHYEVSDFQVIRGK